MYELLLLVIFVGFSVLQGGKCINFFEIAYKAACFCPAEAFTYCLHGNIGVCQQSCRLFSLSFNDEFLNGFSEMLSELCTEIVV